MEKTRMMKSWSKHKHFPQELWLDILYGLPVKSLLRFRCVSKSWQSLIDDPKFSRLHLIHFKNNRHETHLFVVQGQGNHHVVRCSNTFKIIARLGSPEIHDQCINTLSSPTTRRWNVLCSVDGLVMLKKCDFMLKDKLMLWNPSIRKSRSLPPLPGDSSYIKKYADLGMGYVPLINDYKHVRLAFDDQILYSIGVYTISCGSWKTIQFQGKGRSNWCWYLDDYRKPLCFRGCLYIIAKNEDSLIDELVSFDLSTELFASISMPDMLSTYGFDALILVDGGCSLAMLDYCSIQPSIWVLESSGADNEYMHWTKRYTFLVSIPRFLYLKKNGDVLLVQTRKSQVVSYNAETHNAKILLKSKYVYTDMFCVCAYIESLIQP